MPNETMCQQKSLSGSKAEDGFTMIEAIVAIFILTIGLVSNCGGKFWSEGYFVSTVGAHGNEQMIKNYVQQQGNTNENDQLRLF